jgi:O-antigen/teichoic acid export membrane protein
VVLASVAGLIGLFLAVHFKMGLFGVAFANIGITSLFLAGFGLWTIFGRGLNELRPIWSAVSRPAWQALYRTGLGFLILQICSVAIFQSDSFIIARYLPVEQVTPYAVAQRVFAQLIGLLGIVTISLWPAFGNAKALGDVTWIRRIYRKVTLYFFITYGLAFSGLALFGSRLLAFWVGAASAPSTLLIMAIGANYFLILWAANHSLMLNGLGVIRKQAYMMALHAVLAITLNIFFVQRLGTIGLAVGGALSYLAVSAWYLPWLFQRTLKTLGGGQVQHAFGAA